MGDFHQRVGVQQQAGFLGRLAHRRVARRQVGATVMIGRVDPPAGEHPGTGREHQRRAALQQQHLKAVRAVAQRCHGGRRLHRNRHAPLP